MIGDFARKTSIKDTQQFEIEIKGWSYGSRHKTYIKVVLLLDLKTKYGPWEEWGPCIRSGSDTGCYVVGTKTRKRTCLDKSTNNTMDDHYCVGAPNQTDWCNVEHKGKKKLKLSAEFCVRFTYWIKNGVLRLCVLTKINFFTSTVLVLLPFWQINLLYLTLFVMSISSGLVIPDVNLRK